MGEEEEHSEAEDREARCLPPEKQSILGPVELETAYQEGQVCDVHGPEEWAEQGLELQRVKWPFWGLLYYWGTPGYGSEHGDGRD